MHVARQSRITLCLVNIPRKAVKLTNISKMKLALTFICFFVAFIVGTGAQRWGGFRPINVQAQLERVCTAAAAERQCSVDGVPVNLFRKPNCHRCINACLRTEAPSVPRSISRCFSENRSANCTPAVQCGAQCVRRVRKLYLVNEMHYNFRP